jgi:hypothetical protein
MAKFKIGDMVIDQYGEIGIVNDVFNDWENLKDRREFITLDDDELTPIERLIRGDPKDKWLALQKRPYTQEELEENWYSVSIAVGGGIWTSESRLTLVNNN